MKNEIIVVKCCRCHRIRVNHNWLPEPSFLSTGVKKTHTYCPACLEIEMRAIEAIHVDEAASAPVRAAGVM